MANSDALRAILDEAFHREMGLSDMSTAGAFRGDAYLFEVIINTAKIILRKRERLNPPDPVAKALIASWGK